MGDNSSFKNPDRFEKSDDKCPICGSLDFWKEHRSRQFGCFGYDNNRDWDGGGNYVCLGCKNEIETTWHEIIKDDRNEPGGVYVKTKTSKTVAKKIEETEDGFTTSYTRYLEEYIKLHGKPPCIY